MRHHLYSLDQDVLDNRFRDPLDEAICREQADLVHRFLERTASPVSEVMRFHYSSWASAVSVQQLAKDLCTSRQNANKLHVKGKRTSPPWPPPRC